MTPILPQHTQVTNLGADTNFGLSPDVSRLIEGSVMIRFSVCRMDKCVSIPLIYLNALDNDLGLIRPEDHHISRFQRFCFTKSHNISPRKEMVGRAGFEPAAFLMSRIYSPLPSPIWIPTHKSTLSAFQPFQGGDSSVQHPASDVFRHPILQDHGVPDGV